MMSANSFNVRIIPGDGQTCDFILFPALKAYIPKLLSIGCLS